MLKIAIFMDKEIIEIYKERKNKMIELLETMDWEQAVKIVDGEDYQDRIDVICYPNGKKKEYEEEIGEVIDLYAIINLFNDFKTNVEFGVVPVEYVEPNGRKRMWCGPIVNGKTKYFRCLIKRVGYGVYLGNDEWEYNFDNATEEELKDILNGKMSIGYLG